jgi:hypothetical protein
MYKSRIFAVLKTKNAAFGRLPLTTFLFITFLQKSIVYIFKF